MSEARRPGLLSAEKRGDDSETSLRPLSLVDFTGQAAARANLQVFIEAAKTRGDALDHVLFVGPPGSGRSNAAKAFAAALQCPRAGCGECEECRTTLTGAHPDVTLLRTEQLSIGVDEVRALVGRANVSPVKQRYQIVVVEDADRITERGADALLKGLEEPAAKTVWLLCAPSPDDVIVTIRSRCRTIKLVTPSDDAVTQLLVTRDAISPALAAHAARAAQGHVGRARMLARSEDARIRRREILALPGRLTSVTACLDAAENLVSSASEEATQATAELDAKELASLQAAMGIGGRGAKPRNAQAAVRELEEQQKARVKRIQRDALDRVLTEFVTCSPCRPRPRCRWSTRTWPTRSSRSPASRGPSRRSGRSTRSCRRAPPLRETSPRCWRWRRC